MAPPRGTASKHGDDSSDNGAMAEWPSDWPVQRERIDVDTREAGRLPIGAAVQAASGSDIHVPRSIHAASKSALVLLSGQLLLPKGKAATATLGTIAGLGGGETTTATLRLGTSVQMTGRAVPTTNRFMVVSISSSKKVTVKAVLSKVWVFGDVQSTVSGDRKPPAQQVVCHRGASDRASTRTISHKRPPVDESDGSSSEDEATIQAVSPSRKQPPRSATKVVPSRDTGNSDSSSNSSSSDHDTNSSIEAMKATRKRPRTVNGSARGEGAKKTRLHDLSDDNSSHEPQSKTRESKHDVGQAESDRELEAVAFEEQKVVTDEAELEEKDATMELLDSSDESKPHIGDEKKNSRTYHGSDDSSVTCSGSESAPPQHSSSKPSRGRRNAKLSKATKTKSDSTTSIVKTESPTRNGRSSKIGAEAVSSEEGRPVSKRGTTPRGQQATRKQSNRKVDPDSQDSFSEGSKSQSTESSDEDESSETCSESEVAHAATAKKRTIKPSYRNKQRGSNADELLSTRETRGESETEHAKTSQQLAATSDRSDEPNSRKTFKGRTSASKKQQRPKTTKRPSTRESPGERAEHKFTPSITAKEKDSNLDSKEVVRLGPKPDQDESSKRASRASRAAVPKQPVASNVGRVRAVASKCATRDDSRSSDGVATGDHHEKKTTEEQGGKASRPRSFKRSERPPDHQVLPGKKLAKSTWTLDTTTARRGKTQTTSTEDDDSVAVRKKLSQNKKNRCQSSDGGQSAAAAASKTGDTSSSNGDKDEAPPKISRSKLSPAKKRPSPARRRQTPESLRKRLWKASTEFSFGEDSCVER